MGKEINNNSAVRGTLVFQPLHTQAILAGVRNAVVYSKAVIRVSLAHKLLHATDAHCAHLLHSSSATVICPSCDAFIIKFGELIYTSCKHLNPRASHHALARSLTICVLQHINSAHQRWDTATITPDLT